MNPAVGTALLPNNVAGARAQYEKSVALFRELADKHELDTSQPIGTTTERSHLIGIDSQRAQFLGEGIGPMSLSFGLSEAQLTVPIVEAEQLLVWH